MFAIHASMRLLHADRDNVGIAKHDPRMRLVRLPPAKLRMLREGRGHKSPIPHPEPDSPHRFSMTTPIDYVR